MLNKFRNWVAENKADFEREMTTQTLKASEAKAKGEEIGYNLVTGVYAPSYAAGYTAHATVDAAKKLGSKIAGTKAAQTVAHGAKSVAFSAKEGASDGWNHYNHEYYDYFDAMFNAASKEYEAYEDTIMSGGPIDAEVFE